jgi:hypothetical protein
LNTADRIALFALGISIGAFVVSGLAYWQSGAQWREEQRDRLLSLLADQVVRHRNIAERLRALMREMDAVPRGAWSIWQSEPGDVRTMIGQQDENTREVQTLYSDVGKARAACS